MMYAEVILPVPLPTIFTYHIPDGVEVQPGMRVQVPLGQRTVYKGMVLRLFPEKPDVKGIRDITSVLDPYPLVGEIQMKFWLWLSGYYMCTPGEVYRAALPRGLKESYSPKFETVTIISKKLRSEEALNDLMDGLVRAPKQLLILQRLVDLLIEKGGLDKGILKSELSAGMVFSVAAYKGLLRKKILEEYSERSVRMADEGRKISPPKTLTKSQQSALGDVRSAFKKQDVVLLKGVTSSGKTEIYIQLIREMLDGNRQVLYMLPEIALTAQIVERLKNVFGDRVGIYHSKYSDAERVETFLRARENPLGEEYGLILGARSALFLPFRDLGMIIIDEEHEQSYKQGDPAPRYHARDAAIVLAEMNSARVLLGSATPSFESYYNARTKKYGVVELTERYGKIHHPEIILADLREAYRKKKMVSHFTPELFSLMQQTLDDNKQMILFQNRRGFSPYIECFHCGWIPGCKHCDVSLVYHKQQNSLVCHYCGYSEGIPSKCPYCGEGQMATRGFGTEKLEEEVELIFPGKSIARMDLDTTRSRRKYEKIIRDFESGNTQILVGTQIVTKGLDFDNVALVGVLNADNMLNFPDFRSFERSYQLMSQVAGRSGRKGDRGKVVIQTSNPTHPVMQHVLNNDFYAMYLSQMEDRQAFHYPPYFRLLRVTLRHSHKDLLDKASAELATELRKKLKLPSGSGPKTHIDPDARAASGVKLKPAQAPEILGPQSPPVGRVHQLYLMTILVKLPRSSEIAKQKELVSNIIGRIKSDKQYGKLFIVPDVDPF
ncbi:primosomal protein N' [Bacteroidota bacterium]